MILQNYNVPKIIWFFFLIGMLCIVLKAFYNGSQLKKHGIIVQGKIVKIKANFSTKGGAECILNYEYSYGGINHLEIIGRSGVFNEYKLDFIEKVFPVIVNPNTGESSLLVLKMNFEEYNIPFPDSLYWVEDRLKKYLE